MTTDTVIEMLYRVVRFLESSERNRWLEADGFKLYVRKYTRQNQACFDLATVQIFPTGAGTFTRFLPKLENLLRVYGFSVLKIENVLQKRLKDYLVRAGYTSTSYHQDGPWELTKEVTHANRERH